MLNDESLREADGRTVASGTPPASIISAHTSSIVKTVASSFDRSKQGSAEVGREDNLFPRGPGDAMSFTTHIKVNAADAQDVPSRTSKGDPHDQAPTATVRVPGPEMRQPMQMQRQTTTSNDDAYPPNNPPQRASITKSNDGAEHQKIETEKITRMWEEPMLSNGSRGRAQPSGPNPFCNGVPNRRATGREEERKKEVMVKDEEEPYHVPNVSRHHLVPGDSASSFFELEATPVQLCGLPDLTLTSHQHRHRHYVPSPFLYTSAVTVAEDGGKFQEKKNPRSPHFVKAVGAGHGQGVADHCSSLDSHGSPRLLRCPAAAVAAAAATTTEYHETNTVAGRFLEPSYGSRIRDERGYHHHHCGHGHINTSTSWGDEESQCKTENRIKKDDPITPIFVPRVSFTPSIAKESCRSSTGTSRKVEKRFSSRTREVGVDGRVLSGNSLGVGGQKLWNKQDATSGGSEVTQIVEKSEKRRGIHPIFPSTSLSPHSYSRSTSGNGGKWRGGDVTGTPRKSITAHPVNCLSLEDDDRALQKNSMEEEQGKQRTSGEEEEKSQKGNSVVDGDPLPGVGSTNTHLVQVQQGRSAMQRNKAATTTNAAITTSGSRTSVPNAILVTDPRVPQSPLSSSSTAVFKTLQWRFLRQDAITPFTAPSLLQHPVQTRPRTRDGGVNTTRRPLTSSAAIAEVEKKMSRKRGRMSSLTFASSFVHSARAGRVSGAGKDMRPSTLMQGDPQNLSTGSQRSYPLRVSENVPTKIGMSRVAAAVSITPTPFLSSSLGSQTKKSTEGERAATSPQPFFPTGSPLHCYSSEEVNIDENRKLAQGSSVEGKYNENHGIVNSTTYRKEVFLPSSGRMDKSGGRGAKKIDEREKSEEEKEEARGGEEDSDSHVLLLYPACTLGTREDLSVSRRARPDPFFSSSSTASPSVPPPPPLLSSTTSGKGLAPAHRALGGGIILSPTSRTCPPSSSHGISSAFAGPSDEEKAARAKDPHSSPPLPEAPQDASILSPHGEEKPHAYSAISLQTDFLSTPPRRKEKENGKSREGSEEVNQLGGEEPDTTQDALRGVQNIIDIAHDEENKDPHPPAAIHDTVTTAVEDPPLPTPHGLDPTPDDLFAVPPYPVVLPPFMVQAIQQARRIMTPNGGLKPPTAPPPPFSRRGLSLSPSASSGKTTARKGRNMWGGGHSSLGRSGIGGGGVERRERLGMEGFPRQREHCPSPSLLRGRGKHNPAPCSGRDAHLVRGQKRKEGKIPGTEAERSSDSAVPGRSPSPSEEPPRSSTGLMSHGGSAVSALPRTTEELSVTRALHRCPPCIPTEAEASFLKEASRLHGNAVGVSPLPMECIPSPQGSGMLLLPPSPAQPDPFPPKDAAVLLSQRSELSRMELDEKMLPFRLAKALGCIEGGTSFPCRSKERGNSEQEEKQEKRDQWIIQSVGNFFPENEYDDSQDSNEGDDDDVEEKEEEEWKEEDDGVTGGEGNGYEERSGSGAPFSRNHSKDRRITERASPYLRHSFETSSFSLVGGGGPPLSSSKQGTSPPRASKNNSFHPIPPKAEKYQAKKKLVPPTSAKAKGGSPSFSVTSCCARVGKRKGSVSGTPSLANTSQPNGRMGSELLSFSTSFSSITGSNFKSGGKSRGTSERDKVFLPHSQAARRREKKLKKKCLPTHFPLAFRHFLERTRSTTPSQAEKEEEGEGKIIVASSSATTTRPPSADRWALLHSAGADPLIGPAHRNSMHESLEGRNGRGSVDTVVPSHVRPRPSAQREEGGSRSSSVNSAGSASSSSRRVSHTIVKRKTLPSSARGCQRVSEIGDGFFSGCFRPSVASVGAGVGSEDSSANDGAGNWKERGSACDIVAISIQPLHAPPPPRHHHPHLERLRAALTAPESELNNLLKLPGWDTIVTPFEKRSASMSLGLSRSHRRFPTIYSAAPPSLLPSAHRRDSPSSSLPRADRGSMKSSVLLEESREKDLLGLSLPREKVKNSTLFQEYRLSLHSSPPVSPSSQRNGSARPLCTPTFLNHTAESPREERKKRKQNEKGQIQEEVKSEEGVGGDGDHSSEAILPEKHHLGAISNLFLELLEEAANAGNIPLDERVRIIDIHAAFQEQRLQQEYQKSHSVIDVKPSPFDEKQWSVEVRQHKSERNQKWEADLAMEAALQKRLEVNAKRNRKTEEQERLRLKRSEMPSFTPPAGENVKDQPAPLGVGKKVLKNKRKPGGSHAGSVKDPSTISLTSSYSSSLHCFASAPTAGAGGGGKTMAIRPTPTIRATGATSPTANLYAKELMERGIPINPLFPLDEAWRREEERMRLQEGLLDYLRHRPCGSVIPSDASSPVSELKAISHHPHHHHRMNGDGGSTRKPVLLPPGIEEEEEALLHSLFPLWREGRGEKAESGSSNASSSGHNNSIPLSSSPVGRGASSQPVSSNENGERWKAMKMPTPPAGREGGETLPSYHSFSILVGCGEANIHPTSHEYGKALTPCISRTPSPVIRAKTPSIAGALQHRGPHRSPGVEEKESRSGVPLVTFPSSPTAREENPSCHQSSASNLLHAHSYHACGRASVGTSPASRGHQDEENSARMAENKKRFTNTFIKEKKENQQQHDGGGTHLQAENEAGGEKEMNASKDSEEGGVLGSSPSWSIRVREEEVGRETSGVHNSESDRDFIRRGANGRREEEEERGERCELSNLRRRTSLVLMTRRISPPSRSGSVSFPGKSRTVTVVDGKGCVIHPPPSRSTTTAFSPSSALYSPTPSPFSRLGVSQECAAETAMKNPDRHPLSSSLRILEKGKEEGEMAALDGTRGTGGGEGSSNSFPSGMRTSGNVLAPPSFPRSPATSTKQNEGHNRSAGDATSTNSASTSSNGNTSTGGGGSVQNRIGKSGLSLHAVPGSSHETIATLMNPEGKRSHPEGVLFSSAIIPITSTPSTTTVVKASTDAGEGENIPADGGTGEGIPFTLSISSFFDVSACEEQKERRGVEIKQKSESDREVLNGSNDHHSVLFSFSQKVQDGEEDRVSDFFCQNTNSLPKNKVRANSSIRTSSTPTPPPLIPGQAALSVSLGVNDGKERNREEGEAEEEKQHSSHPFTPARPPSSCSTLTATPRGGQGVGELHRSADTHIAQKKKVNEEPNSLHMPPSLSSLSQSNERGSREDGRDEGQRHGDSAFPPPQDPSSNFFTNHPSITSAVVVGMSSPIPMEACSTAAKEIAGAPGRRSSLPLLPTTSSRKKGENVSASSSTSLLLEASFSATQIPGGKRDEGRRSKKDALPMEDESGSPKEPQPSKSHTNLSPPHSSAGRHEKGTGSRTRTPSCVLSDPSALVLRKPNPDAPPTPSRAEPKPILQMRMMMEGSSHYSDDGGALTTTPPPFPTPLPFHSSSSTGIPFFASESGTIACHRGGLGGRRLHHYRFYEAGYDDAEVRKERANSRLGVGAALGMRSNNRGILPVARSNSTSSNNNGGGGGSSSGARKEEENEMNLLLAYHEVAVAEMELLMMEDDE